MQKALETNVLFVSNIDYHAKREDFQWFREEVCGPDCLELNEKGFKMATIVMEKNADTGQLRSRGFWFATFKNDSDAQRVIELASTEQGLEFRGRKLNIVFAEKREPRETSS